jgi:hypothetical protein
MRPALNPERRDKARLSHVCPISIREIASGGSHSGRLFNYSETGFYFESDAFLDQGVEVFIGLRKSPFAARSSDFSYHRTRIMWRRELAEDSPFFYGYGAEITAPGAAKKTPPSPNQRRHPRRPFNRPVLFGVGQVTAEGVAVDISASGTFVKSGKRLRTGQVVTLRIPDRNGKEVAVRGKVVWSNAEGFGLQFIAG